MRILHVITSLRMGGAEKLITEIVPLLIEMGHDVDVCVFDGVVTDFTKLLTGRGIKIISFGKNCNVYNPLFISKLFRLMKGYDVVHTHNTAPQLFGSIASCFAHSCMVTTEHSTSNKRRDIFWLKYFDKFMYGRYKSIICISEKTRCNLLSYLGDFNKRMIVIPNGILIRKYQFAEPLSIKVKSTNRKVITMVSGFRYQKDHETVIRAMQFLNKDEFEIWFVGDGQRRYQIEQCIKDCGVSSNVRLWGFRNDIPSILKSSDIIVQSSHIEGFGLAAVEGMAAGKPVVASNVDGLREVVEGFGLTFPHGDEKTLASIIQKLSNDNEYYKSISDRCFERAQMFDIKKMANSYNKEYKYCMEGRGYNR